MKVAIVHDWLVNFGGAERVVLSFLQIYPDADIFTLVYDEKKMGKYFPKEKVHASYIQKIPFSTKIYTKLLTFMPKAFEEFNLCDYDLVLASSSCCAKGVITPPTVPFVAYIHSPMRYAWDLYFDYQKNSGKITRFFMKRWMEKMRQWDFISSQRIDTLIANSLYISRRIKKFWNRDSTVIYPPVETERLSCNNLPPENFYVVFSRFVYYKRIDLAIDACGKTGRNLVVIGSGNEEKNLKEKASNYKTKITFTGRISDEEVQEYLQKCKALIFCAEEDFGIIPLEAQACGRPVIAFGKGGALETVKNKKTGIFFEKQTVESLIEALNLFEVQGVEYDSSQIALHAKSFSTKRFKEQIQEIVKKTKEEIKIKYE